MPATSPLPSATPGLRLPLLAPRPAFRTLTPPVPGERRRGTRLFRTLDFEEHDLDGGSYARVTEDLSVGGLCARVGFARHPGSRLWLRLYLPEGGFWPLELKAEVVGPYNAAEGLRLRFIQLESGNRAALEDFLRAG